MINDKSKYGTYLREWINIYKKPYIKTWYQIRDNIRLHFPESIKNTRLCDLNAMQIQQAINEVQGSRVRVEIYNIYHGSLSRAYKLGFTQKDISGLLIKPKHTQSLGKSLTDEEIKRFLERIRGTRYERVYKFLLYTGCRRAEAVGIRLYDVDFNKWQIHIRGTKNKTSDRYIPLTEKIFDTFPKNFVVKPDNAKLFPHSKQRLTVDFRKYCPNHKLHDLRHTFATKCLEWGVSMSVVQKWLGHSTITTTSKIYSHVLPEFEISETQKIRW